MKEILHEDRKRHEMRLKIDENMKEMAGSLDEVENEISYDDRYQENMQIWMQEKIRNVRLVGKPEEEIPKGIVEEPNTHIMSMLSGQDFEKLSEPGFGRVEKIVEFLRWKKDKMRLVCNELVETEKYYLRTSSINLFR
jgi:hypothetical protein